MLRSSTKALASALLGMLAAGAMFLLSSKPRGEPVQLKPPPTPEPLQVHVTGEVQAPGVYPLPPGSIVEDAIEIAGGALSEADLSVINLAAPLLDGQQVFVPASRDLERPLGSNSARPGADPLSVIHVNTATAAELQLLPGIGPVLAQKIVEYRQNHGPFARAEDLLNVSGIGPSTLEAIQDLIRVP